jgi:hypothetical protein
MNAELLFKLIPLLPLPLPLLLLLLLLLLPLWLAQPHRTAVGLRTPHERQLLSSHNRHTVLDEAHHVHFPLAIIHCRCAVVAGFRSPTCWS